MDEGRKERDAGDVEKAGFSGGAGVKRMSSLPWASVNYFTPLAVEESTEPEPETIPEQSLKVEKEREKKRKERVVITKEAERPKEGMAEWVLWKMHQNDKLGQEVLRQWMHRGMRVEVIPEVVEAIQRMRREEGMEAVKELRGRKQWIR